ncbi:carotenoid oxygenase family protein [Phenylobacterium sp. SCN 70-31]|uniref:carotenoid oxygenase family protein n=1 Tax=Phenylobacterium sp. SCN 70-31 TaxID=1660129 RepID=UPI00086DC98A|nr:carotenoid oxygenase family protein [Phenylobacterium sp. SCN 70-31]ODT86781.1 MAG: carotenoid oxygenase [Phenylobacterium sp. SCN 70-31]
MDRRELLSGLAATAAASIVTPEVARATAQADRAAASGLDWRVAFADLDADMPRTPMRRVRGRAPAGLSGALYRNGPGKFHRPGGSVAHWFDGDGLVRAFRIADGQATLEARFVDTPKRRADTAANAVVTSGFGTPAGPGARLRNGDDANAANISVMRVGDELWALWESGSPIALDPADLSTKGLRTLRPDLAHAPFLAHPRREPGGDIWNLGVSGARAMVWRLGADGTLKSAQMVELPMASYVHDFTATQRHLVLILQPWVQSMMVQPFADSFEWKAGLGTKVLVLDKDDLSARRVYELPAAFAFHYGAAWAEADGTIRFDGCFSEDASFATENGRRLMQGTWTPEPSPDLSLVTLRPDGRASLKPTGVSAEFPRTDGRVAGGPRRWTLHATGGGQATPLFNGVATHDWKDGRSDAFLFGAHQLTEEAVFVARPGGTAELDGWLLMPSVNTRARATELHVFDARRVADGPLCTWRADRVLPVSLHGGFVRA